MKEKRLILTEMPEDEMWRTLLQYTFESQIRNYFVNAKISVAEEDEGIIYKKISSSLSQAYEYFQLAKNASLNISPILLYYGTINLTLGIALLKTGKNIEAHGHGLDIAIVDPSLIGNTSLKIRTSEDCGFPLFSSLVSGITIDQPLELSFREIMLSIPELYFESTSTYGFKNIFAIPVENIKNEKEDIQMMLTENKSENEINDIVLNIEGFTNCYLKPQIATIENAKRAILRKKIFSSPITIKNLFDQDFLVVNHKFNGRSFHFDQWLYYYGALFVLCSLCRYHPEVWEPFLKTDKTGERLMIDKFVSLSSRIIPNLLLNKLFDCEYSFENKKYVPTNNINSLTKTEVVDLIENEIRRKQEEEKWKR